MATWGVRTPRARPARSSLMRPFCRLSALRGARSATDFMVVGSTRLYLSELGVANPATLPSEAGTVAPAIRLWEISGRMPPAGYTLLGKNALDFRRSHPTAVWYSR